MNTTFVANSLYNQGFAKDFQLPIPTQCPICSTAYASEPQDAFYVETTSSDGLNIFRVSSVFFCPHCERFFYVCYYASNEVYVSIPTCYQEAIYPISKKVTTFDNLIKSLSPKFVEIYHQAELAENMNLTEICGVGYRKATEFLIKDFAIMKNPDDVDKIKEMPFSMCIQNYMKEDNIITLAKRIAWIGNDETHYIRKHDNRNFSDMKNFIKACVYFIGMHLIVDDAESISPK